MSLAAAATATTTLPGTPRKSQSIGQEDTPFYIDRMKYHHLRHKKGLKEGGVVLKACLVAHRLLGSPQRRHQPGPDWGGMEQERRGCNRGLDATV